MLWIVEGYSLRQLHNQCHHGTRQLKNIIKYWFHKEPEIKLQKVNKCKYLLFDGTYLSGRNCCVLGLIDNSTSKPLSLTYDKGEHYDTSHRIFKELKDKFNLNPIAITLDGNTNILKAAKTVWPGIIIQRCLVHIQRQGLSWLRRKPKLELARELRFLFFIVTKIKTYQDKESFIRAFSSWLICHKEEINKLSARDKVQGDLLRAKSLLIHAMPDMFHYLDNNQIPSSTNKVEGFFSRLKDHYRQHRGLHIENRNLYIKWYWYFLLKNY